jgi:hypothetical protein
MYDVFISYARNDKPRAERFQHAIKRSGFTVWWDAELLPGQEWNDVIEAELREAGAVVVLWSKDSINSQFVRDEARLAGALGKLVPVTLDGTLPKLGMGQLQLENMSSWDGKDSDHPGLIKVLAGIRQILKRGDNPPGSSPPPPAPVQAPSSSKFPLIAGAAAAVVVVAAGIIAIPYLTGSAGEKSSGDNGRGAAPPPIERPAGDTPASGTPGGNPAGGSTAKRGTNGDTAGSRGAGPSNVPPGTNQAVKKPLVPVPPPEAAPVTASTAAPAPAATAGRGCASLITETRKRPDVAEGFFELGKCHYDEGRFNESVIAYNAAIEINSEIPKYLAGRALAKWKNNAAPQGIADLNSAIAITPADGSLYESRGQIRFATRDWQGAVDDYGKATRLNSKSRRAWLGLAAAAEQNGDSETAESAKATAAALP